MFETIMKRKQENGEVLSPDVEFVPDSDPTTDGIVSSPTARLQSVRGESVFVPLTRR